MNIVQQAAKTASQCAALGLLIATVCVQCIGAPPPNDNFANRTVLTGSSNEFTATLAEATREFDREIGAFEVSGPIGHATASVWWSWTALDSVPVTLQVIDLPADSSWYSDGINIWALSNITAFPTNQFPVSPLTSIVFDAFTPGMWVSFIAQPGQEYQLQLLGHRRGNFKMRLVADAKPFIFEHPQPQTVPVVGSALFGVMAAGPTPFYYQWLRDGNELPGERAPTLALSALGLSDAREYSVIVSNAYGVVTSQVAMLQVRDVHTRPLMSQGRVLSNQLEFVLNAESNRYYGIESSTNATAWVPAEHFFRDASSRKTSVVGMSNSMTTVSVPKDTPFKLFRAGLYAPASEVCNNNLRRIRYAKRIWAREFHKGRTDTASWSELAPYMNIEQHTFPPIIGICPNDGGYIANNMGVFPMCTLTNHVLEEPW